VLYARFPDGGYALVTVPHPSEGLPPLDPLPGGTIEGRVVDHDLLAPEEQGGEYSDDLEVVAARGHLRFGEAVRKDGSFVIDGLPPGTYEVFLRDDHVLPDNPRTRAHAVPVGTTGLLLRAR
jgi:hypothetical protein